ncbi:MAG TPA: YqaA family protein [Aquabacterium sp.]|nr:YqaA family protein [Aquabacterium sp.]HRH28646.1 YqaA family protein [Aquabacterium sp.]
MQSWFEGSIASLLALVALPTVGLPAVFVVAMVSATLVPMGSEPVVFGLVKLRPELFWPAVLVATAGNTVGGAISWWMGLGGARARRAWVRRRELDPSQATQAEKTPSRGEQQARAWLQRWGAKACVLSWLPVVGDPLCAVAGWLELPFWPCVFYMAIGKFIRYVSATALLLYVV